MTRFLRAGVILLLACLVAAPTASSQQTPDIPVHTVLGSVEVSKDAGLGSVAVHGQFAAVLQRDEGIVAIVDVDNPRKPKVIGRYDDDADQSFDGDLEFSSDGRWLFYTRQTHEFSLDGLHVLDVSDPANPTLRNYEPGGGMLRLAYYDAGDAEWIVTMDAVDGMIVNRFEPTTGAVVPVHASPLPALKVGGPASAGVVIQYDPILEKPLLYASTGQTGVEVFDFSDPTNPVLLGSWADVGLAEIEVLIEGKKRTIFGATEYWFNKAHKAQIWHLNATKLERIKVERTVTLNCPPDDRWRMQGMALAGDDLYVAESNVGLISFWGEYGRTLSAFTPFDRGAPNKLAAVPASPYVFDVEVQRDLLYITDASTGILSIVQRSPLDGMGFTSDDHAFNNPKAAKKARC
jgi:hypothetical protein